MRFTGLGLAALCLASAPLVVRAGPLPCYMTGSRAMGAEGYPAIPYKPCCDANAQMLPKDGDWGLFCTLPGTKDCYATGERAQGADGYPAVEYKPCCDSADEQLPKDGDWGLFCTKPTSGCYNTGERAQGADGYPAVEYKPCCDGADQQLPKDGDWGLFCTKPTTDCYNTGERAQGADGYPAVEYKPCCDGADQQLPKDGDWGLFCTKPGGAAAGLAAGAICDTGAKGAPVAAPCADGLECSTNGKLSVLGICAPPGTAVVEGELRTKCGNKIDGSGPTYVLCPPYLECGDRGGGGLSPILGDNLYCLDKSVRDGEECDISAKGLARYRLCLEGSKCTPPPERQLSAYGTCVKEE